MSDGVEYSVWRWVEAATVTIVLAFFLYATRDLLNPLVLFILLWAVLRPFRGRPGHVALITVAGSVTAFWLLADTGSVLAPFILAILLAYVLDPLVDRMERILLSRTLALGVLTVSALGLLAAALLIALPAVVRQLAVVVQDVPVFVQRLGEWVGTLQARGVGDSFPLVGELLARLQEIDAEVVVTFFEERQADFAQWLWGGLLGVGRGIGTVFAILGYVALTPILTFYLLRDWDVLKAQVVDLIPHDRREGLVSFGRECDQLVSHYLRGQVTVAAILGLITWVGLLVVDFPYAGTLALIVAIFNVVPYLGLVLSLVPAVFIALVSGSVAASLLKVAAVYGVTQLLDSGLISPRIVGDSVRLHPVTVVLVLSLGGYFLGFVGLLIAVPGAAMGKLLVTRGMELYRRSGLYLGEEGSETV